MWFTCWPAAALSSAAASWDPGWGGSSGDFISSIFYFGKILFRKFYFMGPRMGRLVGRFDFIKILFRQFRLSWQFYFMGPIKGLSGFVTLLLHCHFTGSKTENRSTSRATRCLLLDLEDSSLSLDSSPSMEDPR